MLSGTVGGQWAQLVESSQNGHLGAVRASGGPGKVGHRNTASAARWGKVGPSLPAHGIRRRLASAGGRGCSGSGIEARALKGTHLAIVCSDCESSRAGGRSTGLRRRAPRVAVYAAEKDEQDKAEAEAVAATKKWGLQAGLWNVFRSKQAGGGEGKMNTAKNLLKVSLYNLGFRALRFWAGYISALGVRVFRASVL